MDKTKSETSATQDWIEIVRDELIKGWYFRFFVIAWLAALTIAVVVLFTRQ